MRTPRPEIRYPSRPLGPMRPRPAGRFLATALSGVLALVVLAGCTAGGGDANREPNAMLDVNKDNGWTGEDFTFDAQESSDPDGEIESWTFDFGDGSPPVTVTDEEQARVTHAYAKGGQYTVTLTVTDDGKENTGSLTDTESANVVVNERMAIASSAVSTVPGANETAETEIPFQVYEKANRFDLNLTLRSVLATGSSEFRISVLDPQGDVIAEKRDTVGPGASGKVLTLDGLLTEQGEHMLRLEAISGGGTGEGELRIIYGEDLPG